MYTSQEDFHVSHTNGFIVIKLLLNDDVSIFPASGRETHWCGCRDWKYFIVLNVTILLIDRSCGPGTVISQTDHEVTHTNLGYNMKKHKLMLQ